MAHVIVSSARFASMLANRSMEPAHFAVGLKADIDVDLLARETQELDFEVVLALAKRFKRPWPYLLIDTAEVEGKHRRDNRTLANQKRALSPELIDQIALAETMLDTAADLFPEIAYQTPDQPITLATPVAEAAAAVRAFLGVSFDEQLATKDDYATLRMWSAALQERGVYVSMRRLADRTVRAFSIAVGDQAVVVADTQDVPYARVFSFLHEYTHIVLRTAGICDLDEHATVEQYCNAVAASVLMPSALLRRVLPKRHWGTSIDGDEQVVSDLSQRLGVSKASLLIRLRDASVLTQDEYETLETRRGQRTGKEGKRGGNYHVTAIGKVGRRFARNVVGAYEAGSIDRRDASTFLEIPEHNFPGFRAELGKLVGPK